VHQVHHDKKPEALDQLLNVFLDMKQELLQHMDKEEVILFPLIKAGRGPEADCPIAVMHQEHDSAGSALQKIRELTDNFTVPEGACNTWRALWHGLENLEKDLHQHIHLENNIFFPRALNGE
jgi:regulator of cell morphogenesis and NO signaling